MKIHLLRALFTGDGKRIEQRLSTPLVTTVTHGAGTISVAGRNGYVIQVTPRINPDDSVMLYVNWRLWRWLEENDSSIRQADWAVQATGRVANNQMLRVGLPYVPDSSRPESQPPSLPQGRSIDNFKPKEPGVLYYLEIIPMVIPDGNEEATTP